MNDSIKVGELAPADLVEHKVENGVESNAVRLKCPSTNTSDVLIGDKENLKFPLSPGESIGLSDMKGQPWFYKLKTSTDKMFWIAVSP